MPIKKKITPKKTTTSISAASQEKALSKLQKSDKKKNVQRVTVDFPQYLYEKMKLETEDTGQTLKGFIVGLVREHFTRKEG